MGLEYIILAPGFVKEVLDACDGWEKKENMPLKLQELMMVLRIEVDRRYNPPPPAPRKTNTPYEQRHLRHH